MPKPVAQRPVAVHERRRQFLAPLTVGREQIRLMLAGKGVPLLRIGDVTISGVQPAAVMVNALRRAAKPETLATEQDRGLR